jgi:hypothetical protein
MFNQMFDGDFRTRRPTQNLSGNSRSVDRNELVRKAQAERKQREMLRNQQNSAITVQVSKPAGFPVDFRDPYTLARHS